MYIHTIFVIQNQIVISLKWETIQVLITELKTFIREER